MWRVVIEGLLTAAATMVGVAALLGLLPADGSWAERTYHLLTSTFLLDFESPSARQPVASLIISAAAWSLALIVATAALLLIVGVPLGIASATRPGSRAVLIAGRLVSTLSSLPVLLWASIAFAISLRLFGVELSADANPARTLIAAIVVLLIGDRVLADLVGRVQIRTTEIMDEPYMRTVRAAALGARRHLVRSLVPTIAESISSRAMLLVGGAIVAESIFGIDGLGYRVKDALARGEREPQLILALSMALVAIGLLFQLVTRSAIILADPRRARSSQG